jgi:phage terminase small subunit
MSTEPKLTPRQEKFVSNFLVTGNGTQSAMAAGYSKVSARVGAHRLLTIPAVQAEIRARQGVDSQRLQLERQDVIAGFLEAIAQARAQGNPMALLAGWREIGRMLGFGPQRHAVEVSAAADAEMGRLERLSDAELLRLAEAGGEVRAV